ncbi:pepsin/retropepsin-like aspartic protease family protein [uncultured Kordia sp.]|uniref:pepsin/retropepsin-like aspartic protease family protein n=1 Tax=uncultured Kordia sp. TaxID=507699 RepID=UPI0026178503|nr:pepsin/retropepsin-like aspartic protease family protein [uncultured Kordia sp.]
MRKRIFITLVFFFSLNFIWANEEENPIEILFPKAEFLNQYTARIPFKVIDQLIVVEAEFLNQKGDFIIDTGSERLVLNKNHFPKGQRLTKKKGKTTGVTRIIDQPYERKLSEFILHNFSLKNRKSDVIDLSHIERSKKMHLLGIIGYDILKDYEVFIDLYLNQITLSLVDKNGDKLDKKVYAEEIIDTLDFDLKKHTIVVSGFVNNQKVRFALDTGAEFNQLNKNSNQKILKKFRPIKRLTMVGAGNKKIRVLAGKLYDFRLNERIGVGPMYTIVTNLRKMREAYGTSVDGVLGYEFLKYKRTIINYKKEKLYFIKSPIFRP